MSAGPDSPASGSAHYGITGRLAALFIDSRLTPIVIAASILLGAFSVVMLPREEEPQIKVPMVDVLVAMPGFSAREVEERATRPMEKLLWEIPGVEYIYSTSREGESLAIVRRQSRREHREQPGQAHDQTAGQLRPHSARRFVAAHQAQIH